MSRTTKDEQEILHWAARYEAHPVEKGPIKFDGEPAMLGFVFGEAPESEEFLRPLSWPQFFALFQVLGLALVYGDSDYELLKVEADEPLHQRTAKFMQA